MDKLKHMARQAERDTIVFTLRDGTIVQVYSDEFIDCLLHETDRGRRGPRFAHPMVEIGGAEGQVSG